MQVKLDAEFCFWSANLIRHVNNKVKFEGFWVVLKAI